MVIAVVTILALAWGRIQAMSNNTLVSQEDFIIATVENGDLIREVRAPGTLVPIASNFLSATSNGRVKEILLEASDEVDIGTVVMVLDNPELSQAVDKAKFEVEVLRAGYHSLQQRWQQSILKQRIVVADFNARYEMTRLRREANQRLLNTGAVSNIDYNESILLEQQLKFQHELELELLASLPALKQAELSAAKAQINKATRHLALQEKLADDLTVKASTKGIIQEVTLQVGEPFKVGTVLARIAEQDNLKAELLVQESQVKEVEKGQAVMLSAGGNMAQGVVRRINPSVQQGVVKVDVFFNDGALQGARPDLRIDGVIELEHLKNILKLKRPVFTQEYSSSSLFVLNETQTVAARKKIKFGRSSVDDIEVLSSLRAGDQVIISSTNKYDELGQIHLR
ncbi:efflux RND transporter periplasmic adaptor subunit [Thalassomonas actiniarum]|uniref:HlyD family efflux transporter periplasmic adaptor subunit n=1 Tax=Thalassomonas actiniarum TaxID=485447 RepID=A0AAF0C3X4_9GAMM|nr:HlyD family efflux transporter periplasmic adaptor subunit [Thalassomonas actiniarum]WDD99415.1 HlyD family efflux transporter periplasmic adaptor subunit [Thalassomonas actiniarum]